MIEEEIYYPITMPRVAIIILNWNGWQDTIECVQSLLCSEFTKYHIYIVDAASTNDSVTRILDWASGRENNNFLKSGLLQTECKFQPPIPLSVNNINDTGLTKIRQQYSTISLLTLDENRGYAGGNNVGLRLAQAEGPYNYYWVLNNDTVVLPDTLTHLVNRMDGDPSAGICGSTLLYYDSPDKVQTLGGNTYDPWFAISRYILPQEENFNPKNIDRIQIENKMDMVHGSSMFVRDDYINSVGFINEEYFLFAEEIDWAIRGKGMYNLAYAPESLIYHKRGRSTGNLSRPQERSKTTDYYSFRSRVILTKKYYLWCLPLVILGMIGSVFIRISRRQYNHAKVIINAIYDSLLKKS